MENDGENGWEKPGLTANHQSMDIELDKIKCGFKLFRLNRYKSMKCGFKMFQTQLPSKNGFRK